MNYQPFKFLRNKTRIIAITVSLVMAIIFSITILISYQYFKKQKFQQLQSELNLVTENIRKIMNNSNLAAFSLGLTIDPVKDTVVNFEIMAKEIAERYPYIYGLQILRKGEIQYVYPYDVHQSVIGFDILENELSNEEAQKAIDTREIYYAGPLEFQQGGMGIIGRLPIFYKTKFWGFSAVLIKMEDFLETSGITNSNNKNISFQLSKTNPNTGKKEYFTNSNVNSRLSLDYTFEKAGWKIIAIFHQDPIVYVILTLFIFLAIASSFGSGLFAYQLLKKPEELESLLSEKTNQIKENNEYLSSMVQAIPDLIFVYDKDARYLDFHAYQLSLLYYQPKEFIGKSTYELFDEEFAKNIHNAVKIALESKMITEYSYYLDFKEGRKYFESRYMAINTEKVLAVVREVTESKVNEEKLAKSEQKYKSLVSQASDAIFLADKNGVLLELNEIGHEMSEIPFDQDEKFNLNHLIKFEDSNEGNLIEMINKKGTIIQEGILISVNNKSIPIEISCKVTAQNQILGIIRDISVRKNYTNSIKEQNEKLREIAWIQSHEVRAPLARLLGLLDLVDNYQNISEESKTRVIQSLRDSALELDIIIRDVVRRTELAENTIL
ncbi:CHASE domain-containing protein [Marivirga tractuosa]|uniref:CHASE domain-containing protein n=1 Tax=Marivirga tractuosa TaxID=1006 RepID=UPI0035CEC02A